MVIGRLLVFQTMPRRYTEVLEYAHGYLAAYPLGFRDDETGQQHIAREPVIRSYAGLLWHNRNRWRLIPDPYRRKKQDSVNLIFVHSENSERRTGMV
jgi:hypothetical protein